MTEPGGEGQKVIEELAVPLNLDALISYLKPRIPGLTGPFTAAQFSKGLSNPKYLITDKGTGKQYVCKRSVDVVNICLKATRFDDAIVSAATAVRSLRYRKPPGNLLIATAHDVEREFRVCYALNQHHPDLPIPKVYALCEDETIIGQRFFLMEFLKGNVYQVPMKNRVSGRLTDRIPLRTTHSSPTLPPRSAAQPC
jgi:aminoglycoside phosphotransferase (APT) family kinase protein